MRENKRAVARIVMRPENIGLTSRGGNSARFGYLGGFDCADDFRFFVIRRPNFPSARFVLLLEEVGKTARRNLVQTIAKDMTNAQNLVIVFFDILHRKEDYNAVGRELVRKLFRIKIVKNFRLTLK